MSFDATKNYLQKEIQEELKGITSETFNKHYRSDKNFPKPIFDTPRKKVWDGRALVYYFDKKSGR
ncbi:MAG: Cytochrome b5 heme-binding domain-containing protein [Leuconostoc mesenteroides]|jgi:hypothetical protein|uniref:hypothetical protein n=1 Tax=Leuconostoc mesenteroides TaxID=1245 RepID=UPI002F3B3FE7